MQSKLMEISQSMAIILTSLILNITMSWFLYQYFRLVSFVAITVTISILKFVWRDVWWISKQSMDHYNQTTNNDNRNWGFKAFP